MMSFLRYDYSLQNQSAEEGMQKFKITLENAFEQFQKIWNDNSELVVKYKESEANLLEAQSKLLKITRDSKIPCSKCMSNKENQESSNEVIFVSSNSQQIPAAVEDKRFDDEEKSESLIYPVFDDTMPELFSPDFDTDELERNFLQQYKSPPRDVESPPLVASPVFRGRHLKTRTSNSSPRSCSQKSTTVNGSMKEDVSKRNDSSAANSPRLALTSSVLKDIDNSNSIDFSLRKTQSETRINPKVSKKLGISTTHNVQTDIVFGKKSKFKQSKLSLQEVGKVTDVSFCEDIHNTVPIVPETQGTCESHILPRVRRDNVVKIKGPKDNPLIKNVMSEKENKTSCLEDDVIQASPTQETYLSKIRNKLSHKSKNCGSESPESVIECDIIEVDNASICDIEMDTDMTLFAPKAKSTQYEIESQKLNVKSSRNACFRNEQDVEKKTALKEVNTTSIHEDENNSGVFPPKAQSSRCEYLVRSNVNFVKPKIGSPARKSRLSLKKNVTSTCVPEDGCPGYNNANCTYGDETYYSPAELSGLSTSENSDGEKAESDVDTSTDTYQHDSPPRKRALLSSFDIVPRRKPPSPTYAYKCSPVRKKAERAKLNGWDCWECKKYYEAMKLSPEELQARKNKCSRHRAKHIERDDTPTDFWNPDFPDTMHTIYCNE